MNKDDLVSVYQAASVIEANLVKNFLEANGIEAVVSEENEPLAGLSITPSEVMVRRADAAQADILCQQYDRDTVAGEPLVDWKCPTCGVMVPATFDECDQCGSSRGVA